MFSHTRALTVESTVWRTNASCPVHSDAPANRGPSGSLRGVEQTKGRNQNQARVDGHTCRSSSRIAPDRHLGCPAWVKHNLGFTPDDNQARVLSTTIHRGILNCTRQWGKSAIAAAKAVHQAVSEPGSLTIVVSPSARQSGEFVRKAAGFARKLGIKTKGDGDNEISLAFPSGSRIIGLPGTEATIRGFSAVSLLLVDEAARVDDDLYLAIRPMLAVSDGALWLMSTPHGKRGFFYEAWQNGGGDWERIRVPAPECPRISTKFLDEERKTMGDRWFRQEYLCEFTDSQFSVFDRDLLERALSDDVKPLKF
jgi:phage FluMu gp28-like protein